MDNVFIDLGSMVQVGEDSVSVFDETNLFSESDALVGPQGPPGPEGPAGSPGRDGVDGRNATIEIGTVTTGQPGTDVSVVNSGTETDAVLNFTIPRGEQGIQGIQGEPGEDGSDGEAATIQVGSVTTVSSEYPATVTNSGTTSAAVLDFQIPQGIQGVPGQDGADGAPGQAATIAVGTVTTGAAGSSATVTNSGTSSAAVFDFTIPKGDTGAAGSPGTPGAAATISVGSTTTGNAGTSASVTNSGTSSAAVLDFVIPRGDTGATGATGPAGADGFSPTATVTQNTGSATISITDKNGTTTATVYDGTTPTINKVLLQHYQSSDVVVTTSTTVSLASGTITTNGGDIFVSGYVMGAFEGTGGIAYLRVKIDGTETDIGKSGLKASCVTLCGQEIISGVSAGTHTISFGIGIQASSGRQFTVTRYTEDSVAFIEI